VQLDIRLNVVSDGIAVLLSILPVVSNYSSRYSLSFLCEMYTNIQEYMKQLIISVKKITNLSTSSSSRSYLTIFIYEKPASS
jgi:hypothetical protein